MRYIVALVQVIVVLISVQTIRGAAAGEPIRGASAAKCVNKLSSATTVPELLECIVSIYAEIEKLRGQIGSIDLALTEAVIAVDNPGGCPPGWSSFVPGHGRILVGVGRQDLSGGGGASSKFFGQVGGEETVTLTPAEIPKHNHPLSVSKGAINDFLGGSTRNFGIDANFNPENRQQRGVLGMVGSSKPHQNMPPFIAVYFCKKG